MFSLDDEQQQLQQEWEYHEDKLYRNLQDLSLIYDEINAMYGNKNLRAILRKNSKQLDTEIAQLRGLIIGLHQIPKDQYEQQIQEF